MTTSHTPVDLSDQLGRAAQHPLGSGFDATTSTDDVLADLDLTGRSYLVTGGASGLGLQSVRALTGAGAQVIVPARRPAQAHQALDGNDRVVVLPLDLADQADVARFAGQLLEDGASLDGVLACAGVMACPLTRVGPGWELQFAVNHLGHFALVARLLPALKPGARVVVVSSGAHFGSDIRWDDPHFETGYDRWTAYGQSKTANVLFAVQLDARLRERGGAAFALHPGLIQTPLQRHFSREEQIGFGWMDAEGRPAPSFKTAAQGAATGVWGLLSPSLESRGGVYLEDCDIAPPATDPADGRGVRPHAVDPASASRLWRMSTELTGAGL